MAGGARVNNSLGDLIRVTRANQEIGLREAARKLDITPSYLSDIELDRRVPSDDILQRISELLTIPSEHLYMMAGKLDAQTLAYMQTHPKAIVLLRRIAQSNLSEKWLQHMIDSLVIPDLY
jgi:transcriptional regulator with XRE-family HTH domain